MPTIHPRCDESQRERGHSRISVSFRGDRARRSRRQSFNSSCLLRPARGRALDRRSGRSPRGWRGFVAADWRPPHFSSGHKPTGNHAGSRRRSAANTSSPLRGVAVPKAAPYSCFGPAPLRLLRPVARCVAADWRPPHFFSCNKPTANNDRPRKRSAANASSPLRGVAAPEAAHSSCSGPARPRFGCSGPWRAA